MNKGFNMNKEVKEMLLEFYNTLFEAAEVDIPKVVDICGMMIIESDEASTGWVDQLVLENEELVFLSYMYDYDDEYMQYFASLLGNEECNVYSHYIHLVSPFVERNIENTSLVVDDKKVYTIFLSEFYNICSMELISEGLKDIKNVSVKEQIAIFSRMIYSDLFNGDNNFSAYWIKKSMKKCDKQTQMYVRECIGKIILGFCVPFVKELNK